LAISHWSEKGYKKDIERLWRLATGAKKVIKKHRATLAISHGSEKGYKKHIERLWRWVAGVKVVQQILKNFYNNLSDLGD